mgnify:CR=1 FL=1
MRLITKLFVVPALLLFVVGCTGPQESTSQPADGESESGTVRTAVSVAPYETFDARAFMVQTPRMRTASSIEHAVPRQLMEARADKGVEQVVEGFQIQVYSSVERSAAEDVRQEVQAWWEEERDEESAALFPEGMPINIQFGQPYYRVRIGAFAEREQALEALSFVRRAFEDAFIARARVTVTRQ